VRKPCKRRVLVAGGERRCERRPVSRRVVRMVFGRAVSSGDGIRGSQRWARPREASTRESSARTSSRGAGGGERYGQALGRLAEEGSPDGLAVLHELLALGIHANRRYASAARMDQPVTIPIQRTRS